MRVPIVSLSDRMRPRVPRVGSPRGKAWSVLRPGLVRRGKRVAAAAGGHAGSRSALPSISVASPGKEVEAGARRPGSGLHALGAEAPPHRAPHRRTHILGRTGRFTSPPSAVDRGSSLSPFRVTRGSGGAAKVSLVPTEPLCSPQTQAFSIFPKGRSRSRPFVVSPDGSTSLSRDAEKGVVLER